MGPFYLPILLPHLGPICMPISIDFCPCGFCLDLVPEFGLSWLVMEDRLGDVGGVEIEGGVTGDVVIGTDHDEYLRYQEDEPD